MVAVYDPYEAAYVVAKGVDLDHVEPAIDGYVNFYFTQEAKALLAGWQDANATVRVHGYLKALRRIREAEHQSGQRIRR